MNLRVQPWWTAADAAELDALVYELADSIHSHRDAGCEVCEAGFPPCPRMLAAIQVVLDWRERRILISRAKWARANQDLVEYAQHLEELLPTPTAETQAA